MEIILSRNHRGKPFQSMNGTLSIDGEIIATAVESLSSLLPSGTYPLEVKKCPWAGRRMPVIINPRQAALPCSQCQKHPRCSLLMPGTSAKDCTAGSIIVGQSLIPGVVKQSQATFDLLFERIRKQVERGKTVTLTVENQ